MRTSSKVVRETGGRQPVGMTLPNGGHCRVTPGPAATGCDGTGHHQGVSEETTDAVPQAADQAPPGAAGGGGGQERTDDAPEPADQPAEPGAAPATPADTPAEAADTPAALAAAPANSRMARKIVFRIPASSYVAVVFLIVCASFLAVAGPFFTLVYLLPIGLFVWIMRTRTEVDADRLVVRRVLTRTVIPWSRVASLRLVDKGWIRAVRTDGGEIALPSVRTRHLPALALISGGRLTDPTDPASGTDAES